MSHFLRVLLACAVTLPFFYGCEAPLPAIPEVPEAVEIADPWQEWQAVTAGGPSEQKVEEAVLLTSAMAREQRGLMPLIDLATNADAPADQKILASICLSTQRDHLGEYEPQLTAAAASDQPLETRKFAAHLMGLLDTPSALQTMEQLLDDPERAVREAAMGVMITYHPEAVVERIQAFWDNPETSTAIRDQVVLGMPSHLLERFLGIYSDAVVNPALSPLARQKAVTVLGELGGEEHISVLEHCMNNDPDESVRARARGAIALLRASDQSAAVAE